MPQLTAIDPGSASGKSKRLLDGVQAKLGMTPNLLRTLAHSPAALEGYLGFSGALAGGNLDAKLREQIALTVAEANDCEYCLAAHSAAGKAVGLGDEQVLDSRRATSPDAKIDAALRFAREMIESRGWASEDSLSRLRTVGYGDAEIVEIIASVSLNVFTNYFNHVVKPVIDFPRVAELAAR
jgi:uncharacterized peroxidase-related enzyme